MNAFVASSNHYRGTQTVTTTTWTNWDLTVCREIKQIALISRIADKHIMMLPTNVYFRCELKDRWNGSYFHIVFMIIMIADDSIQKQFTFTGYNHSVLH